MNTYLDDDWEQVLELLPAGWQTEARARGGYERPRRDKIESPEDWLRLLLLHGGVGLSLQQTADAIALRSGTRLSKVAVSKRVAGAEPFLQWLLGELLSERVPPVLWARGYRPLAGDGSWVAGSQVELRLDWCVDLRTLECVEVSLADRSVGESVRRFTVDEGEVLIVDRGFSRGAELCAVKAGGGEVIVRWGRCSTVPVEAQGVPLSVLEWLREAPGEELKERPAWIPAGPGPALAGRLCAVKLSPEATARARRKAHRAAQKKGYQVEPETLAWAGWVVVFTTLPADRVTAAEVLELYRARWQVELVFKRLKSLLQVSRPRAFRPAAARVWLLIKLVYALLLEGCLARAGAFSPCAGLGPGRRRGR